MTKIFILLLFFVGVLTQNVTIYKRLCFFNKSETNCMCRFKTKPGFNIPVLSADCTSLNFKEFPRDVQIPSVEDLDLSKNEITQLDSFTNNFQSFKLLSVKLSFNKLTSISQDFFKNTPNLKQLDLSHNNIAKFENSNIFRGLTNLTVLNLSFNSLSTVPEDIFKPLFKLKELDLSYNYLGATLMNSEDFFKSTLGVSPSLEILKIDGIGITQLNYNYFETASNLKYLSISDNFLQVIPKLPYTIGYLDLSGTHIRTISANHLDYHSLKVLKLNRLKKLEKIEHYAFYNLIALEELHLSESKSLNELSDLVFGVMTDEINWSLKKLYLSRTGIQKLNSTFLNLFKNLQHLDLQSNPWTCTCDILWLQKLNGSLYRDDNIRCLSPFNLRTTSIMKLTSNNLPDCFENANSYQRIMISIMGILIGILIILILYLIYLGPFYQTNKEIGPESPYRGNTVGIDPNKAEHLNI
ncbi:hypothetical protein RN001_006384 [Aquatica leii]|uniref:Uncharacterized protein n=1 Tax=Aquatica leii TaxID=1421715 RepID=A0AAN7SS87_9COLE|nr:hypothetical protein RN001_006384 [Aquatica leii]